ncbi:MAG: hypothetical protein KJ939_00105 [Nanoarchaeota archaeon]|nr:hypothetical protein [Nanoarchaeota archaeon]
MLSNLFWKKKIPEKIPKSMQLVIQELKRSENQLDCLKKTYAILTSKYYGQKLRTFLMFFSLLTTDLEKIWKKSRYLHCTTFDYLFLDGIGIPRSLLRNYLTTCHLTKMRIRFINSFQFFVNR